MNRVLLATAALAVVVPAVATAAPGPAPRRAPTTRDEWLRTYRDLASAVPAAARVGLAAPSSPSPDPTRAWLVPAGDLDHDGAGDVADVRSVESADPVTGETGYSLWVDARRGRDGALLWSKKLPGDYAYPYFGAVGAGARGGMIVVSFDLVPADLYAAGAGAVTTSVTAYDGTGAQVWTWSRAGATAAALPVGGGMHVWPVSDGDLAPGAARDLLVFDVVWTWAGTPFGPEQAQRMLLQPKVVDGATGLARDLGEPFVADGEVYPRIVGDVSGDGLDDVVLVTGDGETFGVRVLRSSDGGEPYRIGGLPPKVIWVHPVPDVTGDRVGDLMFDAIGSTGATEVLVDGARGRVLWSRRADGFHAVAGRPGSIVFLGPYDPSRLPLTAYDGSGRVRWSVSPSVSVAGLRGFGSRREVWSASDVDGDGTNDVTFVLVAEGANAAPRHYVGVVDGRTGRVTRHTDPDLVPTPVAIDGRGSDAYSLRFANGALTVTAWRGDAPRALWRTSLRAGLAYPMTSYGALLDRDRCGEVVVALGATTYVLSGATGAPLWALSGDGSEARAVSRPAASVRRFARTC